MASRDDTVSVGLDPSGPVGPQILRILRQRILTNELPPGTRLSEADLSRSLGVSRQPVREALIRLAEAGLVQALPQRGTEVLRISLPKVLSGRFVREAVERAVVRQAAMMADAAALARLQGCIAAQEEAAARNDHAGFLRADDAMHQALAASIGHDEAWTALQEVKFQMDRVRYLSLPDATPMELLVAQHKAILAAIAQRDPATAEVAMEEHLAQVLSALPRLAARFPAHFDGAGAALPFGHQEPGPTEMHRRGGCKGSKK